MNLLWRFLRKNSLERDLERELQFHLDAHVADLMRAGLTREDALREARLALGGLEQARENTRDARGTRWLEDFLHDTRFAWRGMVRSPGVTAAIALTLAIGIGATTAVWSISDALMRRSLPIDRPGELHAIHRVGIDDDNYRMSFPRFQRFRADLGDSVPLASMAAMIRVYARIGEQPEQVQMQLVSGEWFKLLGIGAATGRVLEAGDNRTPGGHPVVVLSHAFWTRRFGSDPAIVGRAFTVNGQSLSVVGVAEAGFRGLTVGQSVDFWVPVVMQHQVGHRIDAFSSNADTEQPWVTQDGIHWLTLLLRAAPPATTSIVRRLEARFRAEQQEEFASRDSASRSRAMREHLILEPRPRGFSPLRETFGEPLRLLLAGVGLLLLIACGNIAGLLMARSAARRHEVAVRVSLGARRGRLIRQMLTESVLLAALGGALGILVTQWSASAIVSAVYSGTRTVPLDVTIDGRVLAFAAVVTVLTGLLFGIAPAWHAARVGFHDGVRGIRDSTGGRIRRVPLGRALVAAQIALSLLLVISAGLTMRTLANVLGIEPGYEGSRVVSARLDIRAAGYRYDQLPAIYDRLQREVGAIPGVKSVSMSWYGLAGGMRRISAFEIPGKRFEPGSNSGQEIHVTPGFFTTVGIRLLKGRNFGETDRDGGPRVAIVSESMARHFFGTLDVLGARFGYGTPPEFEIIGVVSDARVNNLREPPQRLVYYPISQGPQEYLTSLEARVDGPPASVAAGIRAAITRVDPTIPIADVRTIRETLERQLWRERLLARLAGAFGGIALLIAAIGLYGVVAYSASKRRAEMGVRLALGASPGRVRRLVLGDSLVTVLAGLAIGAVLSFPVLGVMRSLLVDVSPHDPFTLGVSALLLLVVGLIAGFVPAWRASRIDPATAIRAE